MPEGAEGISSVKRKDLGKEWVRGWGSRGGGEGVDCDTRFKGSLTRPLNPIVIPENEYVPRGMFSMREYVHPTLLTSPPSEP